MLTDMLHGYLPAAEKLAVPDADILTDVDVKLSALLLSLSLIHIFYAQIPGKRRGLHFPCAGYTSYPFVDLPDGNTLRCKLFLSSKFTILLLSKAAGVVYNIVSDKSEFTQGVLYVG